MALSKPKHGSFEWAATFRCGCGLPPRAFFKRTPAGKGRKGKGPGPPPGNSPDAGQLCWMCRRCILGRKGTGCGFFTPANYDGPDVHADLRKYQMLEMQIVTVLKSAGRTVGAPALTPEMRKIARKGVFGQRTGVKRQRRSPPGQSSASSSGAVVPGNPTADAAAGAAASSSQIEETIDVSSGTGSDGGDHESSSSD